MTTEPPAQMPGHKRAIDLVVVLALLAIVVTLAYQVFSPLFPALLWGFLLAVICAHPYERLVSHLHGRRRLADVVFAILLLLVLLVPAIFFAWELAGNLPAITGRINDLAGGDLPPLPQWVSDLPVAGPAIAEGWDSARADLTKWLEQALSHLGGVGHWLVSQLGSFAAFLFQFVLGAVISLFVLHNRFQVRAFLSRLLLRIGGRFAVGLINTAFETTRNAFAGVIAAALVQTVLAAVALWLAGLPALVLFCGFTFLMALVQIGPVIVLIVAEGLLLYEGEYLTGALLAAWFLGVVMSADNVIRPYFASKGSDLPGILSFLGSIGGLIAWGLLGVFVGPVLASVLYRILLAWVDASPAEEDPDQGLPR